MITIYSEIKAAGIKVSQTDMAWIGYHAKQKWENMDHAPLPKIRQMENGTTHLVRPYPDAFAPMIHAIIIQRIDMITPDPPRKKRKRIRKSMQYEKVKSF